MPTEEIDDAPLYDLGVLFVHGIGQSRQGDTLLRFGEPLRECIERIAEAPRGYPPVTARVVSASLIADEGSRSTGAEIKISGFGHSPGAESGARTESRWLLAEAWWSKQFPPPTFSGVAQWCFVVLPWTLIAHFDRRFRRVGFDVFGLSRGNRRFVRSMIATFRWVAAAGALGGALVLSPLVLAAVLIVALLGAIPIRSVRNVAASLQRGLAATIGDSFVFMHEPMVAGAICTRVRERLEWLSARSRRVVVIAHSQGAAIAHKVLHDTATAPCDVFVSFGSGLAKLAEMEDIQRDDSGRRRLSLASGGMLAAFFAVAARILYLLVTRAPMLRYRALLVFALWVLGLAVIRMLVFALSKEPVEAPPAADSSDWGGARAWAETVVFWIIIGAMSGIAFATRTLSGASWVDFAVAFVFASGLGVAFPLMKAWHRSSGRSLDPETQASTDRVRYVERFALTDREIYWHDLYASADPVPNGPLLDAFMPEAGRKGMRVERVANRGSVLFDHTTYWANVDQFVRRIAEITLNEAAIPFRRLDSWLIAGRRIWRVRWLVGVRWILGIPAGWLVGVWLLHTWVGHVPAWAAKLYDKLLPLPNSPSMTISVEHALLPWLAPLLIGIALWAAAYGMARLCWESWSQEDNKLAFAGKTYEATGAAFVALYLWTAAVLAAIGFLLVGTGGVLAVSGILAAAWLALRNETLKAALEVVSFSGAPDQLRARQRAHLTALAKKESTGRDASELHRLGNALLFLDDTLAEELLSLSLKSGSTRAAIDLGFLRRRKAEQCARSGGDSTERRRLLDQAIEAFDEGARLGDAKSATFAADTLKMAGREAEEVPAYRRAFELGDARAAHALALCMRRTQGIPAWRAGRVLEEGIRRGDPLSMSIRAGDYAHSVKHGKLSTAKRDRRAARAIALFEREFACGYVNGAIAAGDLLKVMGQVDAARKKYALAIRYRSAFAAASLGRLEETYSQDLVAARAAYRAAIRLDPHGPAAVQGKVGLGRIAEAEGRREAAKHLYAEAHDSIGAVGGEGRDAAEAGVALARLIQVDQPYSAQIKALLLRSTELCPELGGEPLARLLALRHDYTAAKMVVARGTHGFNGETLYLFGTCLKREEPETARTLFMAAMHRFIPLAGVELLDMSVSDKLKLAAVLDEIMLVGKEFPKNVEYWAIQSGRTALASYVQQRIAAAERLLTSGNDRQPRAESIPANASGMEAKGE